MTDRRVGLVKVLPVIVMVIKLLKYNTGVYLVSQRHFRVTHLLVVGLVFIAYGPVHFLLILGAKSFLLYLKWKGNKVPCRCLGLT